MSRSASSQLWIARQESFDILRDRNARKADRQANPSPAGDWIIAPPMKPKTPERRLQDKRRRNANLYAPMLSSKRAKLMT